MANTKNTAKTILSALVAMLALALPQAIQAGNVSPILKTAGATSIPDGHLEFCKARPSECAPNSKVVDMVRLNEGNWRQLLAINAQINESVVPVTDQELYRVEEFWTYPNGFGDCEDFALAKRRALIADGWPVSTLLMTVAKQANGQGHAVLMVRTDRGDLVLDNQEGRINLWNETPYHFIKRQSQADAGEWVDVVDDRPVIVADRN